MRLVTLLESLPILQVEIDDCDIAYSHVDAIEHSRDHSKIAEGSTEQT